MKKSTILTMILVFCITNLIHSQVIEGTKTTAVKQATVKIADLEQISETDKVVVKVPNPHWDIPEWTYDESNVIYRQAVDNIKPERGDFRESSPLPDKTFAGLMDNGTSIPPDVHGAAGPDHLMQTLNTEVRISDKDGNSQFTTSLSAFWAPMPNSGSTFDPKIVYDPYAEKWIMVTPSGSGSDSRIYIGVSTSSNPLGEWNMYWIDPDPTNALWFDYPNLGFNKNWISVGGIMRNSAFEAIEFVVFAMDKEAAFNGEDNPTVSRFTTTLGSAIVPSFTYDADQEELYLISTGDGNDEGYGYVNLFELSGDVDDPDFELKGSIGVPEPWENWSYENHEDFLPQMGSSEKFNSIDARMQNMVTRNNKLWAVHHIYIPADNPQRCAVQWWSFDTDGTILERVRIDDPTNEYFYAFPCIAVNANEDVLVGHGVFSENQYAGAAYSYKAYFDEANTMRDFYEYKEGLASYYKTFGGGRNRWGDYSAVFVDPVYDVDFWAMFEYPEESTGADQWGTWWASIKPSFPPETDFVADEILVPTGETVNFTDLTLGVPTTWDWIFEGAEPASSNTQNPTDIQYSQEGYFDVQLISSNDLGTDTILKENYISVSSIILPEVDFNSDKFVACTGELITFTDLSKYSPIQWEWQFDPSTVSFENGTDQSSQNPQVIFDEASTYSVSLEVWNLNGSSLETKFEMITSGGYPPYLRETFEDESLRFEEWIIENPDDDITWELFEVGGTTPGNMAAGIDFLNYFKIGERDRLITPPYNLENLGSAALEFQYAYAKRIPQLTDSLLVYVSGDCGNTWTKVFAGGEDGSGNFATHPLTDSDFWPEVSDDWCMSGWGARCISIDLTPWAGQANIKIAFESRSSLGNPMFIDNIEISQYVGQEETTTKLEDIRVYPNPSSGTIHIELESNHHYTELLLLNQLGQMVYKTALHDQTSTVEIKQSTDWDAGVYFLKVLGDGSTKTKKIIFY